MKMKIEASKAPLSQEALQARRAYQNSYRRKNADKVRQWNKNYWERKAQSAMAAAATTEPAEETQED